MEKIYVAVFENEEASYPLEIVNKPDKELLTSIEGDDKDLVYFVEVSEDKKSIAMTLLILLYMWQNMFGNVDDITEATMSILNKLEENIET